MRKAVKLIAAGAVAAALAAAGVVGVYVAQKRGAADTQALPPLALPAGPVTVLLIGDSRIARWPRQLLPAGCAVIGYGGATARNIRVVADAVLLSARPDTVVIQAGYNDAVAAALSSPAQAQAILTRAAQAVAGMAHAARRVGRRTVVLTVAPPLKRHPAWRLLYGARVERNLDALNAHISDLRRAGIEVIDVRPLLQDRSGTIDPRFAADVSHFSASGYGRLTGAIFAPDAPATGQSCAD